MAEPNEVQKQSKTHIFETRQKSMPDLDLYDDQNREAFSERMVDKYVGKKWIEESDYRNKYEVSHELNLQKKVKKYDIKKAEQPTAESYVQDIQNQQVENNRTAYKRKKSTKKAKNYYKECNKKAADLNKVRVKLEQGRYANKFDKLKREEYDLEMSLLDSRLDAMIEAAKAKSIGKDDEEIRILKAKLAIIICKERLSKDRQTDEQNKKSKDKYKKLADGYTKDIAILREKLVNVMREKYGEESIRKKGRKLLTVKEIQEKEHEEFMDSVSEEELTYLFTRLYEEGQIEVSSVRFAVDPTPEILAQNFEKFAFGAGLSQNYSDSRKWINKHAKTAAGRKRLEGYRRDRAEILAAIDQITGDQAALAIRKMVADNCLPNCLVPIMNVLRLDTNNETFHDEKFLQFCVKPLLKAVTTSAATGIIKDAANITQDQVKEVQLEARKVTYLQDGEGGKLEIEEVNPPKDLYMAIRDAQQYTAERFEMSLGMQEDRIYRHLPSHELNIPLQGSKVHVGFATRYEFLQYVPILAGEFKKLGIKFKLLSGNNLIEKTDEERDHVIAEKNLTDEELKQGKDKKIWEDETKQCGKEITIYPTHSFDPEALSDKAREILYQHSDYHPKSDTESDVRMSVRYGGFLCENLLNDEGEYEIDLREEKDSKNRDAREKTVQGIVDYFKKLKADYAAGTLSKKQLIQAYCLGSRKSEMESDIESGKKSEKESHKEPEKDLFDVYVFGTQKAMNECVKSIPRTLRHKIIGVVRLNLFGVYMVAVPKVLQSAGIGSKNPMNMDGYQGNLLENNMNKLTNEPW